MLLRVVVMRWLEMKYNMSSGNANASQDTLSFTPVYDRVIAMQSHFAEQEDLIKTYAPAVEELLRV